MKKNINKKSDEVEIQTKRPGEEYKMAKKPISDNVHHTGSGKLFGKTAIITGGDSGIGRAVAIAFAKEGADIYIIYLDEHRDAKDAKKAVEAEGRKCVITSGDVGDEQFCKKTVLGTIREFGKIDIIVNNAGEQHPQKSIAQISHKQLEKTFRTNIFSQFFLIKAALPYLKKGSVIINTSSVTAYRGQPELLDYSATKGAIVSFTRSLALSLIKKGIRVNGVAPGAVWTPLIPSTFSKDKVESFGSHNAMNRPGEPAEIAPSFVFLASNDSSFMTGQILHPNGGEIVNG